MQGKFIKVHIRNKIDEWANSIEDNEEVKNAIKTCSFVTGGAIVSLLQGEEPNDYDVYFKDEESLKLVADYYVKKYAENGQSSNCSLPAVQRCKWNDTHNKWTILKENDKSNDVRLRIFIKSIGAVGDDFNNYSQSDYEYRTEIAKLNKDIKDGKKENNKDKRPPYSPIFLTNNAITLSNKIQIVLRFYGEPKDIHTNYDFVHCCSYWTSWNTELVLPSRALESIINKELYYIGSKYPLCSIIRTRKFINRGWTINAGQYVKMVLQLADLDLKNLHVFEEQLIGVDSAYFNALLNNIEKLKSEDKNFNMDSGYLIKLINNVFDSGYCPEQ